METERDFCDPFASSGLLTLPALEEDGSPSWSLSTLEKSLTSQAFSLDEPTEEKLQAFQTHLFSLNLDDTPFPSLESTSDLSTNSDVESPDDQPDDNQSNDEEEGIWEFPNIGIRASKEALLSWEAFVDEKSNGPTPVYLSEAPAGTFGHILHLEEKRNDRRTVTYAQPDALHSSLWELSLGRESLFFEYDSSVSAFTSRHHICTIFDASEAVTSSLIGEFLQLGNDMRTLRAFVEGDSSTSSNQTCKALSAAIRTVLYSLESHLEVSRRISRSLLHLQEAVQKPRIVSAALRDLMENCTAGMTNLAQLVKLGEKLCETYPWLRDVLQEVITRSAASEIELVSESIGLGDTMSSSVATPPPSLFCGESNTIEAAREMLAILADSQQVMALLRDNCPGHPLLIRTASDTLTLRWECSWESISKLQIRALEYESKLQRAIADVRSLEEPLQLPLLPTSRISEPCELQEQRSHNLEIMTSLHTVLASEETSSQDTLYTAVNITLSGGYEGQFDPRPDFNQSLFLSLMPLITSQHRLLSYSVLSLLMETHSLRSHLIAQNRFQLLGDGTFASRLSHALFDSSEVSGEGQISQGGHTGLRLQSRDTWPPASSELRLVLMGILSESTPNQIHHHKRETTLSEMNPLLNSLSFAIRDLSDEDLERCRHADSIYALDFLTLQYKPPPFLESVITPQTLKMYDVIFMHLLRLLRIRSTVQELVMDVVSKRNSKSLVIPEDHKFRLEIHHFISVLADWTQNVVIGPKWATFSAIIERVEHCLSKRDYDGVLESGKGLEHVRVLHEKVVDEIAKMLFLKRRHVEMKAILDDIFGIVLQLAKQFRLKQTSSDEPNDDGTFKQLYERFGKQVKVLLGHLRSTLTGTREVRDSKGHRSSMEQLALRLDMFGYYGNT